MGQPLSTPRPGPRPRPRPSWLEQQQRRRRIRLLRLLDEGFGVRLLLAITAAGLLLGAVNRWENCRHHGFAHGCLLVDPGGIVSINNVEALSICSAAFLYLLEGGQRRRREHRDAMDVIYRCQEAGLRYSLMRNEALERLCHSGIWLDGLDLRQAQLEALQLRHGRLRGLNLQGAVLRDACLQDADLQGSDLAGADLGGADLRQATLRNSDLRGADLGGAALEGAVPDGAVLEGADQGETGSCRSA